MSKQSRRSRKQWHINKEQLQIQACVLCRIQALCKHQLTHIHTHTHTRARLNVAICFHWQWHTVAPPWRIRNIARFVRLVDARQVLLRCIANVASQFPLKRQNVKISIHFSCAQLRAETRAAPSSVISILMCV